ncbi:hypothetical protein FKR81_23570 [Lentzea tibetensis]|uniref:Uncharacterized protein n=1 Tax=Lentzea tibetensis TaxID=2591470 RepID=A0A563EQ23_9PSEU|nr:hypothetical protein [Lentzea tibetensis]TWP49523.1 hypothetical protein FKR81_23570 [Lentzea tibetensis]
MGFSEKDLRVLDPVVVNGRHVKRYEVTTPGLVIDPSVRDAAFEFLPKLYPDFADPTPPVTVTVLHKGAAGMYLNAYNWVWDNVLHCRTAASGDQPFLGSHGDDLTSFTVIAKDLIGCVWELPPLEHERSAWVRHMLAPDEPDLAGYLADTFPEGTVGR